jgi:SAM-dependent methyltransferase
MSESDGPHGTPDTVDLHPDTVLRRAPALRVTVDSSDATWIEMEGVTVDGGIHGLAVLGAFSTPTPFAEALQGLASRSGGVQDWVGLTSTMVRLHEAGVLLSGEEARRPRLQSLPRGFDAARIHVEMLDDRERTSSYLEAIRQLVKPGDVVVDIGTGTGVLALAAARAGARKVYAVEASGIGRLAERVFEANGMGDRITLVEGWSTRIELPEKADVLVSEVIGNDPLGEQVLEVTLDALARHLKPGARLIPGELRVQGMAVEIPWDELARRTFVPEATRRWSEWYGLEFGPLADIGESAQVTFFPRPGRTREWKRLSDPFDLAQIRFSELSRPRVDDRTVEVPIGASGLLNGFVVWFEAILSEEVRLSTHPDRADPACSWHLMVSTCSPLAVEPGDRISARYGYAGVGNPNGIHLLPRTP